MSHAIIIGPTSLRKGIPLMDLKKLETCDNFDRSYSRTSIKIQMAVAVWNLWDRISREQHLDINWLSVRLGKDVKYVRKKLKSPGNWTLNNIADFLAAMDGRITNIEALTYSEIEQMNKIIKDIRG